MISTIASAVRTIKAPKVRIKVKEKNHQCKEEKRANLKLSLQLHFWIFFTPSMWQTTWLTAVHTLIPVSHRPCGGTMTLWAASCHKAAQSKQLHQAAAEKFRKLCDHVNLTRKNTLAHKKQVVEFPRNICLRFSPIKPLLFFQSHEKKIYY